MEMTKNYFSLNDSPAYEGYHIPGNLWNGFEQPCFSRAIASLIMQELNTDRGYEAFRWHNDIIINLEDVDTPVIIRPQEYAKAENKILYEFVGYVWEIGDLDVRHFSENTAIIHLIARAFSGIIAACIGHAGMLEVIKLNATDEYKEKGYCATHDQYDANMAMAEAFHIVLHRKIDLQSEKDTQMWNEAWSMAKANNFWFTSPIKHADAD